MMFFQQSPLDLCQQDSAWEASRDSAIYIDFLSLRMALSGSMDGEARRVRAHLARTLLLVYIETSPLCLDLQHPRKAKHVRSRQGLPGIGQLSP